MRKKAILFDLSFLVASFSNKIDIVDFVRKELGERIKLIVLKDSLIELEEALIRKKPNILKTFKLIVDFVKKYCEVVDYPPTEKISVDMKILRYASTNDCIVATNDKYLMKMLLYNNIPVIYVNIRKKRIEVIGEI